MRKKKKGDTESSSAADLGDKESAPADANAESRQPEPQQLTGPVVCIKTPDGDIACGVVVDTTAAGAAAAPPASLADSGPKTEG